MTDFLFLRNNMIFLLLCVIVIIKSQENQTYNVTELRHYSLLKDKWNMNKSYIYYVDIHSYKMGEENIIQILNENIYLMNNITVSEIDESYIFDNNSEIIKKETYEKENHVKLRLKPKRYYFEVIIKKEHKDQHYFAILIESRLDRDNIEVDITLSNIIQNYIIQNKYISDGNIFSKDYFMDTKIERFYKFTFNNIPLQTSNLVFLIGDKGVSNFYINNITSKVRRSKLFIVTKNFTQESDLVIYLSLLGPANKTKLSIMLDDHDILYYYGNDRLLFTLYIEKLNCTKDYYIFEDYTLDEKKENKVYHLDINSIYGEYEMIYYENVGSNISNIFNPDNETMEILNESSIKKLNIETNSNILKFTCKKPTLLRIKYLDENVEIKLKEGKENILHLDKCTDYYKIYKGNQILTEDINRKYKLFFGYYKLPENSTNILSSLNCDLKGTYTNDDIYYKNQNVTKEVYYEKSSFTKKFSIDVKNDDLYFRLYLISNQYYKNIVEGITRITFDERIFALKIRKDVVFDYFVFKAYSFNKSNSISLDYDLRIVEKNEKEHDKVMVGMNPVQHYLKNEIYIRYSNPYDKFNSKIKEDDYVYLLGSFITQKRFFPIYIDFRYYYNNSIITLEPSSPKILENNKEYKIFGGKNESVFDKVLLNINKCNCSKNYLIKTFYENENNLISVENITEERTFLFHENLFNNTKIILNRDEKEEDGNFNEEKVTEKIPYFNSGDLYMNYFPINEELYNNLKLTKDFSISYEDNYTSTTFKWNDYIINNYKEYPINYSLYILPKTTQINSICQLSLIPPNITLIDQNSYEIYLDKGEYKMSIIASIVNKDFPLTTYYDFLEFEISKKYNIKLIIISACGFVLIVVIVVAIIIYCKKKKKNDILEEIDIDRKSRLLSVAKAIGLDGEQEAVIFKNDEDEDDKENQGLIINNSKRNTIKGEKLKENNEDNANFSTLSDI